MSALQNWLLSSGMFGPSQQQVGGFSDPLQMGGPMAAAGGGGFNQSPNMLGGTSAMGGNPMDSTQMIVQAMNSSTDPVEKAMLAQMLRYPPPNPGMQAMAGLAPIATSMMMSNIMPRQIAPYAPASHGGATAPPPTPVPYNANPNTMQPVQIAQMIGSLL